MIKIKINKDGNLELLRKNKLKEQFCIYNNENSCGDWCPMFRELELNSKYYNDNNYDEYLLRLCKTGYKFLKDEFMDER
jgi:hypothetical protein